MGYQEYLSSDSESSKAWALTEFTSWCCVSDDNLANDISGKFAAVQYFHLLRVGVELPLTATVVRCALKGIKWSHVAVGTSHRVRLPVSFFMRLAGEIIIPSWGPVGRVLLLCLCLSFFFFFCHRFRRRCTQCIASREVRPRLCQKKAVGIHTMVRGQQRRGEF